MGAGAPLCGAARVHSGEGASQRCLAAGPSPGFPVPLPFLTWNRHKLHHGCRPETGGMGMRGEGANEGICPSFPGWPEGAGKRQLPLPHSSLGVSSCASPHSENSRVYVGLSYVMKKKNNNPVNGLIGRQKLLGSERILACGARAWPPCSVYRGD